MNLVEITQDGAALLRAKDDMYAGICTSGVESCVVRAFYGSEGLAVIHDTGQLSLSSIESLLGRIGEISTCHIAHQVEQIGSPQHIEHCQRTRMLQEVCKTGKAPDYLNIPSGRVSFMADGHIQDGFTDKNSAVAPPDAHIRYMINLVNNLFSPTNSQSIPVDIQFEDGNFRPSPQIILSKEKIRYRADKELRRGDQDYMAVYKKAESMNIFALGPSKIRSDVRV
ncbi:hypothetical protein [Asaia sp. SF2.1]|uniref:hypothetical protein n=1 Tax=Asaia sp. SF2.1 TaxID=406101 RepID=UPI001267C28C|nr:hypothetical protein [Asaia sp. SF2.1]